MVITSASENIAQQGIVCTVKSSLPEPACHGPCIRQIAKALQPLHRDIAVTAVDDLLDQKEKNKVAWLWMTIGFTKQDSKIL